MLQNQQIELLTAMLMPPKRPPFPASRFRFAISAICSFRCFLAASSCDLRIAMATLIFLNELKKCSHLFFVRFHLGKDSNLVEIDGFPVSKSNNLIESKEQLKCVVGDFCLVDGAKKE